MNKIIFIFSLALFITACGGGGGSSSNQSKSVSNDLYASEFNASGDSILYIMDTNDGEVEIVGNIPFQATDIAMMDEKLYGVSFSTVYLLDQANANASFIGMTAYNNINALASNAGVLYAATTSGDLLTLDVITGSATLVGVYGNDITSSGDIAFNDSGSLFATVNVIGEQNDFLALVDKQTGIATLIGDTGFDKIFGITFFNNELYGVIYNGTLVKINVTTGVSAYKGQGKSFSTRLSEFSNSNALNIGGLTTL